MDDYDEFLYMYVCVCVCLFIDLFIYIVIESIELFWLEEAFKIKSNR